MRCPACGYSSDKKQRSNQQNKFYHGCVLPLIAEHVGYSVGEVHEILKFLFIKRFKTIGDKEVEYIGSTTELNTVEFEAYIVKVREWCWVTLGLSIPAPNEVLSEEYGF